MPIERARRILVITVVLVHLVLLVLLTVSKIHLEPVSTAICYLAILPFVAVLFYVRWRRLDRLRASLEVLILGLMLTVPVLVSTYLAAGLDKPLVDPWLARIDRALGFDWFALIGFVDARPRLAEFLAYAYSSFFYQLLLLSSGLGLARQADRAYAMVFIYMLICMISSFISIWTPALGTYATYGVPASDLVAINAYYGYFSLDQFRAVRDQSDFLLDFAHAAGIVTFPSVHAAVAALCVWAAWPIRWLRYPILLLNSAMCLSAITHANHYLIDILAGIGLTVFCAAVSGRVFHSTGSSVKIPYMMSVEHLLAGSTGRQKIRRERSAG